MWFWLYVLRFFGEDKVVAAVAIAMLCLTVLSAAVGICAKSTGLCAALCLLTAGAGSVLFLVRGVDGRTFGFTFSLLGCAVGIGYATVYILLETRRKIAVRKAQRAEIKRCLQYTLPDRENGYLRDRLHTALQGNKEELSVEKHTVGVRIGYARKMLAKIKEAPLTPVERIDVEEMARLLLMYERMEKWSTSDIKAISELFSRLLKLSAKYEIAV